MQNAVKLINRYFKGKFRADLTAGLTVGMVVIPQSMAYAVIAGVNPVYGLFTAIIPTIIGAFFGSSPFLITGPTNPTALVTASVLLGYVDRGNYVEYVLALSVLAGLFKLLFGLLKLGSLTRYLSNSVLVGFLSAAGVLIIAGQFGNLLGLTLPRSSNLWSIIVNLVSHFSEINYLTLSVSAVSIAVMLILRKLNPKLPAGLITVALTGIAVYLTGLAENGVRLVDAFGLPEYIQLTFHIPEITLSEIPSLLVPGAAVALFGLMETVSITKAMSQMTGDRPDPSREMVGQGLASLTGGFFHCMPSSGSPSRTVINVVSGAKTRLSAVFSGLSVLLFILAASRLIGYIPMAALGAVVIVSSAGLINLKLIRMTWQSGMQSRIVMSLTFFAALILPLDYAIFVGILASILIFLGESSRINLSYISADESGQFLELPLEAIKSQGSQIIIVNVEGDLYFAAVEGLQDKLEEILEIHPKVLILRFRRTHLLASTGVVALNQFIRSARKAGIQVLFCGIHHEIMATLESAGILNTVGPANVFPADDRLLDSTQQALARAKTLIAADNDNA
ncbi:MAG: SulP family inorganic anion transporter [Anaerolineaceae bacterium]|jgi:SulP family sulfate permease|nr:SulP family inorganic anion transporter [Anaerolineaceae bacterium]